MARHMTARSSSTVIGVRDGTPSVVEQLVTVGMSGYEAKAYVVLVSAGKPLNGYEVAKRSGVPRSTVYETLTKLTARGAAFEVRIDSDAVGYIALPPETLLSRLRREFADNIDLLDVSLRSLAEPVQRVTHHIDDSKAVRQRARDLINGARHELYLSAWGEDLMSLEEDLLAAQQRSVQVYLIRYGDSDFEVGHTYRHIFPKLVSRRLGCRLMALISDSKAVLMTGGDGDAMHGLYSDDPTVVLVALEFIRHDIAAQVLIDRYGRDRSEELFRTDPALRRIALGRE
jgi:HTH-type transcriptional regulator, sugar sensing transcriptional regulator